MNSQHLTAYRLYKRRYSITEIAKLMSKNQVTIRTWIKKYKFEELIKDEDTEEVLVNYAKESARNLERIEGIIENAIYENETELAIRAIMTSQKILDSAFRPAELNAPNIFALINTIIPINQKEAVATHTVSNIFEQIKGNSNGADNTKNIRMDTQSE